ncbi:hypothetical protein EV702DRAFT_1046954 [Suillus placidus]|uniref:DUF6697 domain-containing protein n=1 Tax=Suillus placidus TaxID=48579 RepID=A0A9P7D0V0_9AGAM|nr:hypothetical protein EV702DRAFT_1046954 [Suillus placidus]
MLNEIIELTDSDSDTDSNVRPVKQESKETLHPNPEVAALKAGLTAKTKLVAEQDKQLTKLRKENKQLKNEQNLQTAEIAGLQDELKNILRQLDDQTVKNLDFNMIKLNDLKSDAPNGTAVEATEHQDVDQDMSNSFASNLLVPERPPDAAPSRPSNSNASRSSLTVKQEAVDTAIKVVIKSENENEPDVIKRVTFVKSEDGKFDVWNLEHLGLGPPVAVEERFRVGFRRSVISNALGGGHQTTSNNWRGRTKSDKYPYLAMTRSYNPHLPLVPGGHGVVFCGVKRFDDGSLIEGPIDLIASDKPNQWIYLGSYKTSLWGEISPHQLDLLQPLVIQRWVSGALSTQWGKSWVKITNAELVDKGGEIRLIEFTEDGLREALNDGRLVINFTVMKCVGYRTEWFEQFLHYQAHPKAPKSQKRKKQANSEIKKPSAKRMKGSARQKEVSSESDGDDELQTTPPGSDEDEFSDVEDGMKTRLGSDSPAARKNSRMQATRGRRTLYSRASAGSQD